MMNKTLASDLYIDKNTHHTKLKWKDNGGIGWTIEPNDDKMADLNLWSIKVFVEY